jgi:ribosomal protein S12 methylthiotransferase accessory factor YcaO
LVFPRAPPNASYAYSRSSGVAAGPDFAAACRTARAELVERDRFLRSWYGETVPEPIELSNDSAWEALAPFYDLRAYAFPVQPNAQPDVDVVAVFGFPKVPRAPLVYGFGADVWRERALRRASNETLQRWAFLRGEAIPERAPAFSTTAEYHQEFYLWPAMHARLRAWLAGSHAERAPVIERRRPEPNVPEFVELGRTNELSVVRALPRSELPLVFGCGHPNAPRHAHEPYLVHPFV